MRAAHFDVSTTLLADALHLPVGATIIGAFMVSDHQIRFTVDDPQLPEVDVPLLVMPTVTRHQEFTWEWNAR